MQKYTMTAKCVFVGPVQEIGSKGFKKREIVLCENESEKYPHYLAWELKQDRVNLVNESYKGKILTVSGYPESRAWTDSATNTTRYFTSMSAVSVSADSAEEDVPSAAEPTADMDAAAEDDGLPF